MFIRAIVAAAVAGVGFAGGTGDVAGAAGGGNRLPLIVSVTSGGSIAGRVAKRARGGARLLVADNLYGIRVPALLPAILPREYRCT